MITSRDNSHLKHARAVRGGKSPGEIFLEGLRLCEEAVSSGISLSEVLYTSDFALEPRSKALLGKLKAKNIEPLLVPEKLLESVSDTNTPQGIVIIAARPAADRSSLDINRTSQGELPLVVVLHEMNNPSNLGAVLRTAEAAGVRGVIVSKNSADPFSPKALRGAMGASLRLPVWYGAQFGEAIQYCKQNKMAVTCADISGAAAYTEIDWCSPGALVIGSEAHGLSGQELALCDQSFRIPMAGPVESLNAAVAAGIVMFEARRQFRQQT